MKLITLCQRGSCCPVVKVYEDKVEIGEEGNLCTLTLEQWETLKPRSSPAKPSPDITQKRERALLAPSLFISSGM